jgi:hypothetical protein
MTDQFDLTQNELLHAMQNDLDFTLQYNNGRLFLSDNVVSGLLDGFEVGVTVCPITGELIEPKVTRELNALKGAVNDLFDKAVARFKDHRSDPVQYAAICSFCSCVYCQMIKIDMAEPADGHD